MKNLNSAAIEKMMNKALNQFIQTIDNKQYYSDKFTIIVNSDSESFISDKNIVLSNESAEKPDLKVMMSTFQETMINKAKDYTLVSEFINVIVDPNTKDKRNGIMLKNDNGYKIIRADQFKCFNKKCCNFYISNTCNFVCVYSECWDLIGIICPFYANIEYKVK